MIFRLRIWADVAEFGIRASLRCLWEQSLGGSSPLIRTNFWILSSIGRASRLHRGGYRFESYRVHRISLKLIKFLKFIKRAGFIKIAGCFCRVSSVVEQRTENPCVPSSILGLGTKVEFPIFNSQFSNR